jgi:hypothetical protein
MNLSKSTFIRGLDCPLCLRHAADRRPSSKADDEFLRYLAEGGFQFERLVRHAWPGVELPRDGIDAESAHRATVEAIGIAMAQGGAVLHEATILHDGFLARIDMLRVFPDRFELCEIKAKSFRGTPDAAGAALVVPSPNPEITGARGIRKAWRRYVADVAFQSEVLERWLCAQGLGHIRVLPRLVVANSSQPADRFDAFWNVRIDAGAACSRGGIDGDDVDWVEEPPPRHRSRLICELDVSSEVDLMHQHGVGGRARLWAGVSLAEHMDEAKAVVAGTLAVGAQSERGWKCRDCEFRATGPGGAPGGFDACWDPHAPAASALLRLHRGGGYRPSSGPAARSDRAPEGSPDWVALTVSASGDGASVAGLPHDAGTGKQAQTRNLQIDAERGQAVQRSAGFADRVRRELVRGGSRGIMHFIDFETSMACLPFAEGMRPYEVIAFQFSCHSVPIDGDRPRLGQARHVAWLNESEGPAGSAVEDDRLFVDELRRAVGDDDSPVFHWATHERTVLGRQIRARLESTGDASDDDRIAFIDRLIGAPDCPGRLVDMLKVAEGGIMAPGQQGRYSIKYVLPAACRSDEVWESLCELMGSDLVPAPAAAAGDRDPYALLHAVGAEGAAGGADEPEGEDDDGGAEQNVDGVRCGTDAMRAFQKIRFGNVARWPGSDREAVIAALKRYCKLDTAAMVAAWLWMVREAGLARG